MGMNDGPSVTNDSHGEGSHVFRIQRMQAHPVRRSGIHVIRSVRPPQVRVIIVNWNGRHHLGDCLPSVLAARYPLFAVTVCDNGSRDGSVAWLEAGYPQVDVIPLGSNRGFAAANNVGLRQAMACGAEYAVLLNNDTRVEADWLAALVDAAETDELAAVCQAQQRSWDGECDIAFRFIPEWADAEHVYVPVRPVGPAARVPFASGCAMLLRCAALERIGLFDERYFMYVEDVDLSLRAWIAGYRVLHVPAAVVYHRMRGSGAVTCRRMFWGYRNQLSTLIKLYQTGTLARFGRPIAQRWFLTRNRTAIRGTLAAAAMLPGTLRRRGVVQRFRRVPDSAFLELCQR